MAHFAEMNGNEVVRVVVINDAEAPTEAAGIAFCKALFGQNSDWMQCSFSGSIRGRFPGAGYTYDAVRGCFVAPSPFPSWLLDEAGEWQPPVPRPMDGRWKWDEQNLTWLFQLDDE